MRHAVVAVSKAIQTLIFNGWLLLGYKSEARVAGALTDLLPEKVSCREYREGLAYFFEWPSVGASTERRPREAYF